MNRNGFSREAAEQRIASQLALPQKLARATHQIDNSGSREDTLQQVDTMMDSIVPGRIRTGFWWTILAGPALFAYGVLAAWDFGDQAITRLRTRSVIAKDKKM